MITISILPQMTWIILFEGGTFEFRCLDQIEMEWNFQIRILIYYRCKDEDNESDSRGHIDRPKAVEQLSFSLIPTILFMRCSFSDCLKIVIIYYHIKHM